MFKKKLKHKSVLLPTHFIANHATLQVDHKDLGEVPQQDSDDAVGEIEGWFVPFQWSRNFMNGARTPPQAARKEHGARLSYANLGNVYDADYDDGTPVLGLQATFNGAGLQ